MNPPTLPHAPTLAHGKEIKDAEAVLAGLDRLGYIADRALATALYLVIKLGKPLLLEGHAGLGKTEVAKALASFLNTPLIRLQCYEGLDVNSAVYEWNYQKQLLVIRLQEGLEKNAGMKSLAEREKYIFSDDFLLKRPLLQSVLAEAASPVLLVDEVDRADEAFEAFLLELLSDFQVSIPEVGTIKARHIPCVVLTSNRSRELSDALKRRCLYHWIDYPGSEKEMRIVRARLPGIDEEFGRQLVRFIHAVRQLNLAKPPGVAETLDWARALLALGKDRLDAQAVEETLGCFSKSIEDTAKIEDTGIATLLARAAG